MKCFEFKQLICLHKLSVYLPNNETNAIYAKNAPKFSLSDGIIKRIYYILQSFWECFIHFCATICFVVLYITEENMKSNVEMLIGGHFTINDYADIITDSFR